MKKNNKIIFIITAILFLLVFFLSLTTGVVHLSLKDLTDALIHGAEAGFVGNIFWYVRFPRTLACILAGAGLSVAGVVVQNVLANKLASPSIIGINAGAGLAVTICIACQIISGWGIAISAFLGGLVAVVLIVGIAQKLNASRTTVILCGVAMNSFFNAISEAITTLLPEVSVMVADFRVGGFASVTMERLLPAGILIVFAILLLCTLCNELDVLNLGEEVAHGLGLSVKKMRTIFLGLAALLASASVSFAGLLGFVGLIIPHIARKLVGNESKYLLPFCALAGATFITLCDMGSRLLFQPYEIPVGIVMSFIGGPFFIYLLLKSKGGHQHA